MMIRLFLGSKLQDHQCGFKAFKRDPLLHILDKVEDDYWFWDTEQLPTGMRHDYRVKEIPVKLDEAGSTKVKIINNSLRIGWPSSSLMVGAESENYPR